MLFVLCLVLLVVGAVGRVLNARETHRVTSALQTTSGTPAEPALTRPNVLAFMETARNGLEASRRRDSNDDEYFFAHGIWNTGRPLCVRCNIGPGVVAAALASAQQNRSLLKLAVQTIDPSIKEYQTRNGSLGPGTGDQEGPDIQTMVFAAQLGLALYAVGPQLDEGRRDRWTEALRGATEFLINNGNYAWYTNGNIVLGNALVAALAWKATGDDRYRTVYIDAMEFAQRPGTNWPGRGLVMTRNPSVEGGLDGAGYLTEAKGNGRPGFDADYTQVQADMAAMIALVTEDSRAVRLTNLLVNQLMPRVDRSRWLLNSGGGTRHTEKFRLIPFTTSAVTVLARRGRPDLAAIAGAQSKSAVAYLTADRGDAAYKMWGNRLAPMILAMR
ncbi:hypothetical protein [Actinoplanes sp. N902-109]|uniref:hypothetical protein n=1 Tax=Actinoplanes sp. (strain N902-109) TaxID=649831 RepID=UPI0018DE3457|nr:hypothetical protein [Actinoplanes sp. N902-109]